MVNVWVVNVLQSGKSITWTFFCNDNKALADQRLVCCIYITMEAVRREGEIQ